MNRNLSHIFALSLSLTAVGCGSVETMGTGEDGADAGGPADLSAPLLVSTSPVDGAIGQGADVEVLLSFSEPMDKASVEAELDTSALGAVTLAWNSTGDTLTISPEAPLAYAEGIGDPSDFAAEAYVVELGAGATDVAGNPIGSQNTIEFTTLKSVSTTVAINTGLSRVVNSYTYLYAIDDPFVVGDRPGPASEEAVRSAMTFDLSTIPEAAQSIIAATLSARQLVGEIKGTPYADLGGRVVLDHVVFSPDGGAGAAFASKDNALSTIGEFMVEGQVTIEVDVTAAVDDDLAHRTDRSNRSQFLTSFEKVMDQQYDEDRAVYDRDAVELAVTYLHP